MTLNADRCDVSFTEVLFQLCETNNHESLQLLLDKQQLQSDNNEDIVNVRDPSGQTPLYAAVASQSLNCARVLLEFGADPNYSCSVAYFCRTPLHFCAAEGSAVELLLNNGAEPLLHDLHGDTCLTLASRAGHYDLYSLMSTCTEQRDQMFELIVNQFESLLLNGDVDAAKNCILSVRNRRQTFLKHFSRHAQAVIIKCIERNLSDSIRVLADIGIDCMSMTIEPNGDNILHCAARLGADKVATVILERWPSLFCRTSALGRLPLHEACERGRANIVRLFLNYPSFPRSIIVTQQSPYGCYEFPIDINHVDADCRTGLLDACASGNVDTVKALLEARFMSVGTGLGVSLTVNSPSGNETPVGSLSNYVSNLFRRMKVPSSTSSSSGMLFSHSSFQMSNGPTLTTPTTTNNRPVRSGSAISLEDRSMQAAFGDFEIVSPQPKPTSPGGLFSPLDLNVFSYDRTTPLLSSIRIQNRAIAALLLQSGADPELPAQWRGYTVTPLHAAVELRDGELVDLLLQSGAIDNDCAALESALRSAPHLVPIFLRRWSEVDREVQINVDSVAELAELSRCKTESVVPVAINWREKPQLRDLPQAWLVGCAIFHNPALLLDDFVACSVITRLDISSNALRILPSYLFHMQSLQTLNAASNQIEDIAAGGIQRSFLSSSLRDIDLSFNRLQTIPSFVFWLKNLNKLYADNNLISSLPSDVWENSSLSELKLANNRLEVLPLKRLGRHVLPKQVLEARQSQDTSSQQKQQRHRTTPSDVSKIQEQNSELQQHDLWSLELSSDVGVIADGADSHNGAESTNTNCCGVRFLDLSNNHISVIPASLVCLAPLLRTLNLSSNNINLVSRWPSDFPPALHTLDLSSNKITVFAADDSITQRKNSGDGVLPCANPVQNSQTGDQYGSERARSVTRPDQRRVRSRSADRRKGSDAERRVVASCCHRQHTALSRLRTLNLSNNGMINFTFDSATAPGITQLDLSSNKINVLPQGITQLQNLSVLNVSNTQITTIPPELSRLNRLWSLEITNCPLVGELGALARGRVRTADIIYHLRASLDRARLRPITRLLVCGLPGSGKSTLIEALKRAANTNSPSSMSPTPGQDSSQPLIDWGQLTVDFRPDGPLTFRLCELSARRDFRYLAANFLTQRCVVLVTFPLTEHPTSQIADLVVSMVRDINLLIPSAPVLIIGTFADTLAVNAFENGSSADVMPIWRRKLTAAFQQGDPTIPHVSSSSSFNSGETFDMPVNGTDISQSEEVLLPGNCKLMIVSTTKNRKKNGIRLLKEAHKLAFEWRGGVNAQVGRTTTPGHNSYQSPPTLKQTVPAIFADLEIVVSKLANSLLAARLPPLLKAGDFQAAVKQQLSELNYKPYRDVDELNQCVRFLHEIGLIFHFDEPSVSDLYFLSVEWLSRLFADIINAAVRAQSPQRGLLAINDAVEVLNRHEPTGILTQNKLISLLARFDAAFSWDGGSHILVPGFLPSIEDTKGVVLPLKQVPQTHRPTFRLSLLDPEPPQNRTQSSGSSNSSPDNAFAFDLNRFYVINHIPLSFWPRLIVRLLPCELLTEILWCLGESLGEKPSPVMRIWDTRIEFFTSESAQSPSLTVEQLDRLHLRPGAPRWSLALSGQLLWSVSSSISLISIRVPPPSSLPQPSLAVRLMSFMTEFVDQLLEDWYPAIGSRFAQDTLGSYLVYRLVPCPTCFAGDDLAMVSCFQIEECMAVVCPLTQSATTPNNSEIGPSNSALTCQKGHILDVASAAPDLVFADIPKSQLVDCAQFLDKANLLGCGALGPVISVSLAKLQQQVRKSALISSTNPSMHQTISVPDNMSFFLPRTGSFSVGQHSKSVAIKFFNPVDIDLSSVGGATSTGQSLVDNYRRLDLQLRRRFKADPIRLACEAYTSARLEMSVLLSLRHQHVVGLVGVSIRPLGLLLQLAPLGSLLDWLQSYRRVGQQFSSNTVIQVIAQVADALAYLHRMGIIFRDIKSSNVLVWRFPRPLTSLPNAFSDVSSSVADSSVQVRVSDFSIARWSGGFGSRGQAGTPGFMAPEIIQFNGEETYSEKVDCFSFGMLIYELLTLRLPFEDRPSVNARHAVLAGLRPPPTLAMFTYGQVFTDLIASCWRKDPAARPSASEIFRIANWPGMSRVVSISSISGLPELLCTAPVPAQAGIRGAILARWSAAENRTKIDSISFDGDECFSLQRLAEHPPSQRKNSLRNSSAMDAQQQVIMITCLTMSTQLLFAADIAGLIHCYRLGSGEYLGCVPAGRTGCHAISLYCCNESCEVSPPSNTNSGPLTMPPIAASESSQSSSQDTLLALYSNSLLVVLRASANSNPVLAPISRFELDPGKGTVCCMAVIRHLNQSQLVSSAPGMVKSISTSFKFSPRKENGLTSKLGLFEKKNASPLKEFVGQLQDLSKTSTNRVKSFFTRPASSDEPQICGPGVSELWLGCFDGSILLCSPKSLSTPTRIRAPVLSSSSSSLSASGSTTQGPPIASLVIDSTCESVFATLYLSSIVSRWSVRQRVLLAHFDFGEQITSILPQSSRLLLGTISGCIISSDLSTLRPLNSFPMHADSTLALLPVYGNNNSNNTAATGGDDQDLVVSLGRGLAEPLSELLPQAAPTSRMCIVSLSFS